jgi:hypothetical protein
VVKLEPANGVGDPLRRDNAALFTHYHVGKQSLSVADAELGARVRQLCSGKAVRLSGGGGGGGGGVRDYAAVVFVSDWPRGELRQHGLDAATLRDEHAQLVYALYTPFGIDAPEELDVCGAEAGAYFVASGFAKYLCGHPAKTLPSEPTNVRI